MANLQQVGIEFQVKGEATASQALKRFADSGDKVGTSVTRLGDKISGIEREYRKLNDMNKRGVTTSNAMETATNKLASQLSTLTGMTEEQARAALKSAEKSRTKAEADKRAAREAEKLARAQKNLEGSVLKQARAVDQAVRRMDELKRLQQSGAAGSRDMAKAEIEVARALARTNGYLKSNGDLNTQKALAELRAAQATRKATKETEEKARSDQRAAREAEALARETEQLAAAYNPVMAAARVYEQRIEQLNRAKKLGVLTEDQMQAELAQSAAAYNEVGQDAARARNFINNFGGANHIASRQTNAFGMAMQQGGYQVGDFIVQVQSGTNAFVAFGQQATQLVGILPMMAGQFGLNANKLIGISAALGIAIPLVTALGAALVRTGGAGEIFDDLAFAIEPIKPLLEAISYSMSAVANTTVDFVNVLVNNLDRIVVAGTVVTGFFAVKWVAAFVAAGKVTATLSAALGLLRKAMLRIPFVAIVAAATELVFQFIKVVKLTGSVGEAFSLLGKVAAEVFKFESLKNGLLALNAKASEVILSMTATFMQFGVDIVSHIGEPFNKVGAVVMGTVEGIRATFNILPSFIQNIGVSAANFFISGMESLSNGAVDAVNAVIKSFNKILNWVGADKFAELFGFSGEIGIVPEVKLDRLDAVNEGQKAGEAFAQGFNNGYDESLVKTPVVDTLQSIVDSTRSSSEAMGKLADTYGQAFMDANPALESLLKRLREVDAAGEDIDVRDWFGSGSASGVGGAGGAAAKAAKDLGETIESAFDDAYVTAEEFSDLMKKQVVKSVDTVSDAFTDFLMDGMKNFDSFKDAIIGSFRDMLRMMVSTAVRNQIVIPIATQVMGGGGGIAQSVMGGGGGFGFPGGGSLIPSILGTGGAGLAGLAGSGGIIGGIGSIASGVSGIFSGGGLGASFANLGGLLSGSIGGLGALGAAIPAIGLIAVGITAFIGKTKELDRGLDITVKNMDALVKTFSVIEKSRFFGLSKKVRTRTSLAPDRIADPITQSIVDIQKGVLDSARALGVSADVFRDFSYQFDISLKGLSEEDRMKKLTENLQEMGDSFASLIPGIENINQLMEVTQQRYQLETRLLQLQGEEQELLARRRAEEKSQTHELNQDILKRIHMLEDQKVVEQQKAQAEQETLRQIEQRINQLNENDFATLLGFRQTEAALRMGVTPEPTPLSSPQSAVQNPSTAIQTATSANSEDIKRLRSDMKQMHKESMLAYSKIIKNGKDSRDTLRQWNVTGLPEERTT